MRVISQAECHQVSGSFLHPGFVTDDFAVAGATIGLISAVAYNICASYYPNRTDLHVNSAKDIATSTLWTGVLGAKYGFLFDLGFGAFTVLSGILK